MNTLRHVTQLLVRRWRSWLVFELSFRAVELLLAGPLIKGLFDAAMALSGYTYLTFETIGAFALTPPFILFALFMLVLLTLLAIYETSGLYYAFSQDESVEDVRFQDMVRYGLHRSARALRARNILVVPYILLLMPLVQLGVSVGLVRTINLPEFIMEYVIMNPVLTVAYTVVLLALAFVALLYVFWLVFFVADDISFVEANRRARAAGKHHALDDLARIVLVPLAVLLGVFVAFALVSALLLALTGSMILLPEVLLLDAVLITYCMGAPVSLAVCLGVLQLRGEAPDAPQLPSAKGPSWAIPAAVSALMVASLASGVLFVISNIIAPQDVVSQLSGHPTVLTVHRSGTFGAPENTMAAFIQAKADGTEVCEIDVQQSKDGVIFVSHDSNFLRVSGVNKAAWELTWDEISKLDATGEIWQGKVEPQGYPLLEEVVSWAEQNDMMLNIELKPTGHETDFEKSVADIVNAHNFGSRCIVTSQAYDTVARMKEYAPEATCTYVTAFAYGDICQLDAADAFSVEELCATPTLVSYLHDHDKQVLAWVVNSRPTIESMMANGVDNVITDDVPLARQVIDEQSELSPAARVFNSLVTFFS